jgi:hypothetical protein
MKQIQKKTSKFLVATLSIIFLISTLDSCKPKENDNPEEVITTLKLTFSEGSNTKVFQFKDADGLGGGLDGVADTIVLDSSKNYRLVVEVLDESTSPLTVVSDEILNEGVDHQFFFNISTGLMMTHAYDDLDSKGLPIGLSNKINSSTASTGTLRVNLKHQPSTKNGSQAIGSSDIDVSFYTIIK